MPAVTEMPDVHAFRHDLSNVVLYVDTGDDIVKVKIEDFPSNAGGVKDPNDLPVEQFVADHYPDGELVAMTVKAGANAVKGYGPGEGELFILKDGVEVSDLPMADKADVTYTFDKAFDGLTMGETVTVASSPVAAVDSEPEASAATVEATAEAPAATEPETAEQDLGVTMGDQQGLAAAEDEFTFDTGETTGTGGDTDGWTEMVIGGDDGAMADASGWSNHVKDNVHVKDKTSEKHCENSVDGEKPEDQVDSIGW